jgi:hypothetical protein
VEPVPGVRLVNFPSRFVNADANLRVGAGLQSLLRVTLVCHLRLQPRPGNRTCRSRTRVCRSGRAPLGGSSASRCVGPFGRPHARRPVRQRRDAVPSFSVLRFPLIACRICPATLCASPRAGRQTRTLRIRARAHPRRTREQFRTARGAHHELSFPPGRGPCRSPGPMDVSAFSGGRRGPPPRHRHRSQHLAGVAAGWRVALVIEHLPHERAGRSESQARNPRSSS